jgi:hypothetical protein
MYASALSSQLGYLGCRMLALVMAPEYIHAAAIGFHGANAPFAEAHSLYKLIEQLFFIHSFD